MSLYGYSKYSHRDIATKCLAILFSPQSKQQQKSPRLRALFGKILFHVRVGRIARSSRSLPAPSTWAPPHGSLLLELARSGVRFSLPRRNDAPLAGITCLLSDHCAGRENRTPTSSLARTRPTTKRYPHVFSIFQSRFSHITLQTTPNSVKHHPSTSHSTDRPSKVPSISKIYFSSMHYLQPYCKHRGYSLFYRSFVFLNRSIS